MKIKTPLCQIVNTKLLFRVNRQKMEINDERLKFEFNQILMFKDIVYARIWLFYLIQFCKRLTFRSLDKYRRVTNGKKQFRLRD